MPKKRKEKIPTEENNSFIEIESTLKAVFLAILIVGLSVGCTFLVTQEIKSAILIILGLTTLSVFASFFPTVRHWKGSFQAGEYLLLIFCLAIGLMADFSDLFHKSTPLLLMTAGVMYGTFLLHLFLAWWWKIDRDTVMITATAAIYGPAFIGQIISVIDNRKLLFSGMATGLVGYALGNFLGIGVANLLKSIL